MSGAESEERLPPMYCEDCKRPGREQESCPVCASRKYRPIWPDDFCFLRETPALQGDMLADVLNQSSIPHLKKSVLGAALSMQVGRFFDRYRFYVRYDDFSAAQDIVYSLFGGGEQTGDAREQ